MPIPDGLLTKAEAHDIVLGTWRRLPLTMPRTYESAVTVANHLSEEIHFQTLGNRRDIILAWLVQELKI